MALARPRLTPATLMQRVKCDLPSFAPGLLAEFEKTQGQANCLAVGDEFHIRILGPWNGSVRVTAVGETYFELITLDGHPEAGRIRFAAHAHGSQAGALEFEICSWARARDGLVAFAYDTLGVGRHVQEATWRTFCERVAVAAGGQALGPVSVETVVHDPAGTRHEHHA
ncbi:DUF1990 family protein [uncultured Hymenobacter sp.]|uniref:DUF1990 family protein n=1 Tax=uncultured Hymenobacter sp. TaxID=170016 RepID=UPI0035CC4D8D